MQRKSNQSSDDYQFSLPQSIQAGVVIHNADTGISMSNITAQQLLGLTEDQMLGKTALDPAWKFVDEDGKTLSLEEYPVNRVIATREPLNNLTQGIFRPSDGDIVWVLVNAVPTFDHKGELDQVVVTFVDITQRKQVEEELKKQQELLDITGQMAQVGGWYIDLKTYALSWTKEVYSIYEVEEGFTPTVESAISFFTDPHKAIIESAVETAINEGIPYDLELEIRTAKGNLRWTHAIGRIMKEDGVAKRLYGSFQDITERKEADNELAQYKLMFDSSSDAIIVLDAETGCFVKCNDAAFRMHGYESREAFLNLSPGEISPATQPDGENSETLAKKHIEEALRLGSKAFEWLHQRPDGSVFWALISLCAIELDGKNQVMAIGRDLTRIKALQKEVKALRGILPLCSFCKKIRDDDGYWQQVDAYITQHSEADISHSICMECLKAHYPEEYEEIKADIMKK